MRTMAEGPLYGYAGQTTELTKGQGESKNSTIRIEMSATKSLLVQRVERTPEIYWERWDVPEMWDLARRGVGCGCRWSRVPARKQGR
jgi:hypothetical protein